MSLLDEKAAHHLHHKTWFLKEPGQFFILSTHNSLVQKRNLRCGHAPILFRTISDIASGCNCSFLLKQVFLVFQRDFAFEVLSDFKAEWSLFLWVFGWNFEQGFYCRVRLLSWKFNHDMSVWIFFPSISTAI